MSNLYAACTSAFIGYTTNEWVIFTAGHCVYEPGETFTLMWRAKRPGASVLKIGKPVRFAFGPTGDSAIIRTSGTNCEWCPQVTSPIASAWTVSEHHPINSRAWSYEGQFICRFGITTAVSCGLVQDTNVTIHYTDPPSATIHGMFTTSACSQSGDSGGPYIAGNAAVGIHSGSSSGCGGNHYTIADEIRRAENRLDAWVLTAG